MEPKRYRRQAAAEYLTSLGLPIAPTTLAKLAVIGGGPEFQKWGRLPVYTEPSLRAWAERRLGKPATSTTEHRATNHAA